jgi:hypothetical protein
MNQPNNCSSRRPEVLVLESPEVAIDQWTESLPEDTELDDDLLIRWDRWVNACRRLDSLGVIMPDHAYPLSWCLKQVSKKAIRSALKNW